MQDKILVSGSNPNNVQVTNDGATILQSIGIDNPAAKVLVDLSRVQDAEVGDGTTSVTGACLFFPHRLRTCSTKWHALSPPSTNTHTHSPLLTTSCAVLAAELLRQAEKLIDQKMHPQTIIAGWRRAVTIARRALEEAAIDNGCVCVCVCVWLCGCVGAVIHASVCRLYLYTETMLLLILSPLFWGFSEDTDAFRHDLVNIARTTLSSKILTSSKDYFANLAVDAVLRIKVRLNPVLVMP